MPRGKLIALEASSASITTASVTIRTLRVDSRQLTMGTFRQLPDRPLIDPVHVALLGTVWGWVNYDCTYGYRNFIVQFGDTLHRCSQNMERIELTSSRELDRNHWPHIPKDLFRRYKQLYRCTIYRSAIDGDLDLDEDWRPWFGTDGVWDFYPEDNESFPNFHESISNQNERVLIRNCIYPHSNSQQLEGVVREMARQGLREVLMGYPECGQKTGEQLRAAMSRLDDEFEDYRRRWNDLLGKLMQVEQLYIAT